MYVEIPDDILRMAEANAGDVLLAVAVQFYADNRIDYEDACRLAGVSKGQMNGELARRGIGIHQYPSIAATHRQAG